MALLLTANDFPQQSIQCASIKYGDQASSTPRIDTVAFFRSAQADSAATAALTKLTPTLIDPTDNTDFTSVKISDAVNASSPAVALASVPAGDGSVADGFLQPMSDNGGTSRAGGWEVLIPFYGEVTYSWSALTPPATTANAFAGWALVDINVGNANSPMPIVGTMGLDNNAPATIKTISGSYRQKFAVGDFIELRAASLGLATQVATTGWSIRAEVLTDLSA